MLNKKVFRFICLWKKVDMSTEIFNDNQNRPLTNTVREHSVRGFSLVEIIISTFISLVILGAIATVTITGKTCLQIGNVRTELQQDLRQAMDKILGELRQSGSFVIRGVPPDGSWRNTINFRKPESVIGGNMIWGSEEIQYLLGGINGRQLLREAGSEEKVLANNILSFQIRRQSATPDIIEIALKGRKITMRGFLIEANLNFQFKLRN